MRKIKKITVLIVCVFAIVACSRKADDVKEKYTCPMHPSIVKQHPGQCPICGMELVRKNMQKDKVKLTSAIDELLQPPNRAVVGSTRMAFPVWKSMNIEIEASGFIISDIRSTVSVPVRTAGRIERIFVYSNFQAVRKGEKILEIYSPELMNAQQEFLFILKSDPADSGLLFSAKKKLEQAGMDQSQIKNLAVTKTILNTVAVYSPAAGYIEETTAEKPKGEFKIREGQYVQKGEDVLNVIQTDRLRAEIDFPQSFVSFIKINNPINFITDDGSVINARVDFIQPFLSDGSPFVKIRSNLSSSSLRPGQLVKAVLRIPSGETLWIPKSARRNLGTREIAFVKKWNSYHAKTIRTRRQSGEWAEVVAGVAKSDTLAFEAGMMADGDSFIATED